MYVLILLAPLIKEESVNEFNSNVKCFYPLVELLAHLENALDQHLSLFNVDSCDFVISVCEILHGDEVIKLVPGLILEHLRQKLRWRYISIKLLIFMFDC